MDGYHALVKLRATGSKVTGLGVNPTQVPPSGHDLGLPGGGQGKDVVCYTGSVSEVIFNCFGNFEGFVLESCDDRHRFRSIEAAIGELVLRPCKERLSISVCVRKG